MEQIIQLKTMRDEALVRLQNNPDYKLVNSLDALIQDLESVLLPAVDASSAEAEEVSSIETQAETVQVSEEATDVTDTVSVGDKVSEDNSEINEQLEELAADFPDEASSAIEALEAELSQAVTGVDDDAAMQDTAVN